MVRLTVDSGSPDPAVMAAAADMIGRGGLIVVPTDTLYGLAADPFNASAVERLFEAKGRAASQALPLIAADRDQIEGVLGAIPPAASALARCFWPGPLTLLLPAPPTLAPGVASANGRVGVRVPAHAVALALCRACGRPLTATSANRSGEPATNDPEVARQAIGDLVDLLLDGGMTPGGPPSTVVDATVDPVTLVREGAISWQEVRACLARG